MSKRIEQKFEAARDDIAKLEQSLSGALKSVNPPADVMQRLQQKIGNLEPNYIAKRLTNWELWIITVGAVMSAAMVIITIARAFYYFFKKLNGQAA